MNYCCEAPVSFAMSSSDTGKLFEFAEEASSERAPAPPVARMAVRHPDNNFDITRLCLATFVFLGHYTWIFPNGPLPAGLIRTLIGDDGARCVQAFFVISGFLMFQSFQRSGSVLSFFEKRVRRIMPAYVTVIFLSALLGAALTRLNFHEYFSGDLAKYIFWNLTFLNFMHPTLPGLFEDMPVHYVNGPLWTLKVEVAYYCLVPVFFWIGRRLGFVGFFAILYVISVMYHSYMIDMEGKTGDHIYGVLSSQLPGQLSYFISGALIASWRREQFAALRGQALVWKAVAGAALIAVGAFYAGAAILYPAALAVLVLSFCLSGPRLGRWLKYGDWSYGVYVIHFPVLQGLRSLGLLETHPILLFLLTSALVFAFAFLLWHFIEGPALKGRWVKRRAVPPVANVYLATDGQAASVLGHAPASPPKVDR
jgi:peptidoglycan/LPS O-acetylase OafA/YrhL